MEQLAKSILRKTHKFANVMVAIQLYMFNFKQVLIKQQAEIPRIMLIGNNRLDKKLNNEEIFILANFVTNSIVKSNILEYSEIPYK